MDIGIGLPTTVTGASGADVLEWALRAERHRFSTLAVLDRLAYDNLEPVVALAAAAAVTRRIRLAATVLIAAYRGNDVLLAKQLASVAAFAPGRLVVGVAAGGRADDFELSGVDYRSRGANLDAGLARLRAVWSGATEVGPVLPAGARPTLLVGGHSDAAMRRAAEFGDGWIAGGSSAHAYAQRRDRAVAAWHDAGRPGQPRTVALGYFGLDPARRRAGDDYLGRYYAYFGAGVSRVLDHVVRDAGQLAEVVGGFREAGCDELLLFPISADPDEVDRLAEALAQALAHPSMSTLSPNAASANASRT
jgi:alkanesulfonate monooxygenase SsuD/methylene tetrahydromethanopterin reductase-like flavin-dependent oxidoreductase (luciferase family)